MKHVACSLVAVVLCACSQPTSPSPSDLTGGTLTSPSSVRPSGTTPSVLAAPAVPINYGTHLSGDEVVPVPRETRAQGQAIFQLSRDGAHLSFRVIASNIENVVGAHIHRAAAGSMGPLVVLLVPPQPPAGGRSDGVLGTGEITGANLLGPLAGQPLSALIAAIEAGNAYVDIPTNNGVMPINEGPGDFPSGELRGQIH